MPAATHSICLTYSRHGSDISVASAKKGAPFGPIFFSALVYCATQRGKVARRNVQSLCTHTHSLSMKSGASPPPLSMASLLSPPLLATAHLPIPCYPSIQTTYTRWYVSCSRGMCKLCALSDFTLTIIYPHLYSCCSFFELLVKSVAAKFIVKGFPPMLHSQLWRQTVGNDSKWQHFTLSLNNQKVIKLKRLIVYSLRMRRLNSDEEVIRCCGKGEKHRRFCLVRRICWKLCLALET